MPVCFMSFVASTANQPVFPALRQFRLKGRLYDWSGTGESFRACSEMHAFVFILSLLLLFMFVLMYFHSPPVKVAFPGLLRLVGCSIGLACKHSNCIRRWPQSGHAQPPSTARLEDSVVCVREGGVESGYASRWGHFFWVGPHAEGKMHGSMDMTYGHHRVMGGVCA